MMAGRHSLGPRAAKKASEVRTPTEGGSGRHRGTQGRTEDVTPITAEVPVVQLPDEPENLGPLLRPTGRARVAARVATAAAAVLAMGGASVAASTLGNRSVAPEPPPQTSQMPTQKPITAPTAAVKPDKPVVRTKPKAKPPKKAENPPKIVQKPAEVVQKPNIVQPPVQAPPVIQNPVPPREPVAPVVPKPAPPVIQPPVQKPVVPQPPIVRPKPPPVEARPVPNPGIAGPKGQAIAAAALAQVGARQDCTMLVTNSLRRVNINHHGWPVSYFSLGYTVAPAQAAPGDLVYYANGGAGLAHIAVYIGNGQAVHGGWTDAGTFIGNQTVIFSVNVGSGPVFIRVR